MPVRGGGLFSAPARLVPGERERTVGRGRLAGGHGDGGQGGDDAGKQVGFGGVAHQVGVLRAAVVVDLVSLEELTVFHQQGKRRGLGFSVLDGGFDDATRVAASVDGDNLHARREACLRGGREGRDVADLAGLAERHAQGVDEGKAAVMGLIGFVQRALRVGVNEAPAAAGDAA